ncbi:unnamed protein product [marine sediment metagenome]|uniref:Uncharacterized protein n=1 Tax=marine sediment metagenome TaxID=412755 RepID=X1ABU2_9ZZZZ
MYGMNKKSGIINIIVVNMPSAKAIILVGDKIVDFIVFKFNL